MLNVLALCDTLGKAAELHRRLRGAEGVRLELLVCNNAGKDSTRFFARILLRLLRWAALEPIVLLRLLLSRALHVRFRHLHDERVVAWLRRRRFDAGLHAAGVIYRKPILDSFRLGILNPHIGLLPRYRGRSVMEWSILEGNPTGVTVFFVDEGIDTGARMVLRREVGVSAFRDILSAKKSLFSLDAEMFAEALAALRNPNFSPMIQKPGEGRRYYVMSELFAGAVTRILEARVAAAKEGTAP